MHVTIKKQSGVALAVTLIMLVVMTLGAIAMVRSMDTTTLIAGNLAFRQGATYAADVGVENAMNWLATASVDTLTCGAATSSVASCPAGYKSNGGNAEDSPSATQTWDQFWVASITNPTTLDADAAGNTVSWFIHRLCTGSGALTAFGSNCVETPSIASSGGYAKRAGATKYQSSSQVYYRVTVRVTGKKNTVSYVQAIIAL